MRLSGIVGEDFTADELVANLAEFDGADLRINLQSPGGIITDGLAMYEHFQDYSGRITVRVESLAASIASVLMLGADVIEAGEVATVMVHNPWAVAIGDSSELREQANVLDHLGEQIAKTYARRSGQSVAHWLGVMNAETYFTAEDALGAGLIDRVISRDSAPAKRAAQAPSLQAVAIAPVPIARANVADALAAAKRMKIRIFDKR